MSAIPAKNGLYRALDLNGDGSGSFNQNVDGTTPKEFYIKPPAGTTYVLRRLNGLVIGLNFNDATKYETLTALTNGIEIFIADKAGNRVLDFTEQVKIKRSYDYSLLAGVDITTIGSANADPLTFRWTFARGPGDLILNGDLEEKFVVKVSDNISSITDQIMMIQGFKRDNKTESQLGT